MEFSQAQSGFSRWEEALLVLSPATLMVSCMEGLTHPLSRSPRSSGRGAFIETPVDPLRSSAKGELTVLSLACLGPLGGRSDQESHQLTKILQVMEEVPDDPVDC